MMKGWGKPDDRLRLLEVMQLRRIYLREPLAPEVARDFEAAKRRCLACHVKVKRLCEDLLAIRASDGFQLFCPNSHFLQHVRAESLKFR